MTLGDLLLMLGYVGMLYDPISTIAQQGQQHCSPRSPSAERAFALLDEAPDVPEPPGAVRSRAGRAATCRVRARRRSRTATGPVALEDVSFEVPAGQPSGHPRGDRRRQDDPRQPADALLPIRPTGAILLDGVDLRDYRVADLRNQFGIVLQEPVLFSTTIAENIAYARRRRTASRRSWRPRKLASAHEFISALPDGYDTRSASAACACPAGSGSASRSLGRSCKDAPILILDEPTSSVDVATEALIMEAMERLMAGRTTFMIAHRLSTLRGLRHVAASRPRPPRGGDHRHADRCP